jgi:hypothetical protein
VSIPIIVLHRVTLPTRQKVIVGTFLCLSLTMVVMALTRSAKIYNSGGRKIDIRWTVYWVHVEACIAVITVSLTSFRTAFNQSREVSESKQRLKAPRSYLQGSSKKSGGNTGRAIEMLPRSKSSGLGSYFSSGKTIGESTVELSHNASGYGTSTERADRLTPAASMEEPNYKAYTSHA